MCACAIFINEGGENTIMNKQDKDSLKCPACESRNIMTNRKKERFCRKCGNEWKKNLKT